MTSSNFSRYSTFPLPLSALHLQPSEPPSPPSCRRHLWTPPLAIVTKRPFLEMYSIRISYGDEALSCAPSLDPQPTKGLGDNWPAIIFFSKIFIICTSARQLKLIWGVSRAYLDVNLCGVAIGPRWESPRRRSILAMNTKTGSIRQIRNIWFQAWGQWVLVMLCYNFGPAPSVGLGGQLTSKSVTESTWPNALRLMWGPECGYLVLFGMAIGAR